MRDVTARRSRSALADAKRGHYLDAGYVGDAGHLGNARHLDHAGYQRQVGGRAHASMTHGD